MKIRTRKLKVPEKTLHRSIAQLLVRAAPKFVMWWHTPNGEKRDKITAAILKSMGTQPGVPDFLLYDTRTGYLHCLEIKAEGEHLSDAQKGWKARFDVSPTGRYAVARSMDDAILILQEWWPQDVRLGMAGLLVRGSFEVIPPKPRRPKAPQHA
jgi:hypothetical protein